MVSTVHGHSGGLAAGSSTIALVGSPQGHPVASATLPRDLFQLLPLLGLIVLALGIGVYGVVMSAGASLARPATRRSPSRTSGLLPGPARWDATPHERLEDAKYLGLILEAELGSPSDQERSRRAATRVPEVSTAGQESEDPPTDPASAA